MSTPAAFAKAYDAFIQMHASRRSGERLRRLQEGHSTAERLFLERVWWPAFGHFQHLHPEYEVTDFKDGHRYLDFAYLRAPFQACIEIDGYGPHWRDASRWQFADHLMRQNHLVIEGWTVLRFTFDDVTEKPRRCQQLLQQWVGRIFGDMNHHAEPLGIHEKEIVRFALASQKPLTPAEVSSRLHVSLKFARKLLRDMADKQLLAPASGSVRIRSYELQSRHITL